MKDSSSNSGPHEESEIKFVNSAFNAWTVIEAILHGRMLPDERPSFLPVTATCCSRRGFLHTPQIRDETRIQIQIHKGQTIKTTFSDRVLRRGFLHLELEQQLRIGNRVQLPSVAGDHRKISLLKFHLQARLPQRR